MSDHLRVRISLFLIGLWSCIALSYAQENTKDNEIVKHFLLLITSENETLTDTSLNYIQSNWHRSYEAMLIESLYFSQRRPVAQDLIEMLENKTGQHYGADVESWYRWLWNKPASYGREYFHFKANLYSLIDPRFGSYFAQRQDQTTIRLDEVMWGGVKQDGIPPLRNPKMILAKEASYLEDDHIVFGIEINGDARAYPKRILAWHEMFNDTVGDIHVAGVYCTLCGTVVLYNTGRKDGQYRLGTSGFLYRSNKLMYDAKTQSLWSTMEGKPVIGPLANSTTELDFFSVVTTSWGLWKKKHPQTKVLSLETGHLRDYSEGAAYRTYFATDELMFQVPETDNRLKNKDEILAIRMPAVTDKKLAISSSFLQQNIIYPHTFEGVRITVFTARSGGHRVYNTQGLHFKSYDGYSTATDVKGVQWSLEENALVSETGQKLERIASYNAFWFGFRAAFPDTTLVH